MSADDASVPSPARDAAKTPTESRDENTSVSGGDAAVVNTDTITRVPVGADFSELISVVRAMNCGSIVLIDDRVPDIEAVRGDLSSFGELPPPLVSHNDEGIPWPDTPDERWDLVQTIVDRLSFDERRAVTTKIYELLQRHGVDWQGELAEPLLQLEQQLPTVKLLSVGPREWEKHGPTFGDDGTIAEGGPASIQLRGTALFLFDYDLTSLPARRDNEGLQLAKRLVEAAGTHAAYCGLVSQRFNTAHARDRVWDSLNPTWRDRLVLIPRTAMQDYRELAEHLRRVSRAHSADKLRRLASEALRRAHDKAMTALDSIEVAPLLHVVADLSYVEGISEFETIRRLYLLKFQRALDQSELDGAGMQAVMREIRTLQLSSRSLPPAVIDLENEERYHDVAYVNRRCLPVELGDVFKLRPAGVTKSHQFVVATHPCDLMVRSDGRRPAIGGQKETTHAVLLPVSDSELRDRSTGFELPYARSRTSEGKRGSLFVRFRPPLYLPLFVLDYCVFSGDGNARFVAGGSPPESVPAGLAALYRLLDERAAKVVRARNEPAPSEPIRNHALDLIVPEGAIPEVGGRVEGQTVSYDCQRVMRIAPTVGMRLLLAYTQFAGRSAADMDMGRPVAATA